MVTGTLFPATKFCDFLCACYNFKPPPPPNLQSKCDGYGISFDLPCSLSCLKGGLVIEHHNEVHGEILYLAQQAFTSGYVRTKPLIHQGRTRSER